MEKQLIVTIGVKYWLDSKNVPYETIGKTVIAEYNKQADVNVDGGSDKDFFTFTLFGQKFFVAKNEIDGLTIMLPDEY